MDKANKKKHMKNIAVLLEYRGTLRYGNLVSLSTLPWAIFCFASGLIFTLLVIFVTVYESSLWALTSFLPLLYFIGGIMVFKVAKKRREKIYLWLDDMLECLAQAVTTDSTFNCFPFDVDFLSTECFIKIEFDCKEQRIIKYATGIKSLFTQYVGQYSDREIRILYSPKYDQMLILKDDAPKFENT